MKTASQRAAAKVNLTLHVTGQRPDGYHLLDSLVVFADVADTITAERTDDGASSLTVSGPFADGVPTDMSNLILRAAAVLQPRSGGADARLHLEKNLPHAAGIGSGSSDAAATFRLLADLWDVALPEHDDAAVLALGADVPVCLAGPSPLRMSGIGEVLAPVPDLPPMALVLVRPDVAVPTGAVFQGLATKTNPSMTLPPERSDFAGFIAWLSEQRNDLQPPAIAVAPAISDVIAVLSRGPDVAFAGMSGSGATCFAILPDMDAASALAATLTKKQPDWWVAAAPVL